MILKEKKEKIMREFAQSANDTGSSALQVAVLTERIQEVSEHLKKNKHDFAGQRGLIKMVGKRRSHLRYLEKTNPELYTQLIQKLGIRK